MSIETYRNLPLGVQEKIKAMWREGRRDEKANDKECKVWDKLYGIVKEFIPLIEKNKKTHAVVEWFCDDIKGLENHEFAFFLVKNNEDSMNISENPTIPFDDNFYGMYNIFNGNYNDNDKPYVIMWCKKIGATRVDSRRDAQQTIKMLKRRFYTA